MGVPKFYRWISERYPCLSQVVKDYQVPEFDNFYLDMNGIIHVCSHPNDDDPTFRISEDKIFTEIFRYIEALFRMIKPRKVLFLAVDGVAPRAKMNQQRGRRFRSAREAQDLVRKALQKGTVLPSEPRFDSNCITPGTEFMVRLHEQLKYFVNLKVSTDPSWQSVEVVLSGQEVPGEGEHKIMDYIRHQKAQPGYSPNTRHCLYGLDADLMMLGLVTHEPHFCLLREEVRFGRKNQKRHTSPSTVTFHLLHLTILREYIEHEFSSLKTSLPFPYSLESVIDDWVLLGFLVGNDFLPNLPNMHIKQSTLPFLYKKYREVLPKLDGYINEAGNLHMRRFETYLKAIAEFDYDYYSELISDMKWMEAKTVGSKRRAKKTATKSSKAVVSEEQSTLVEKSEQEGEEKRGEEGEGRGEEEGGGEGGGGRGEEGDGKEGGGEKVGERELVGFFSGRDEETSFDDDSETTVKLKRDLGISSINDYFEKEDDDRIDSFESDLAEMKSRYYQEKLGFVRIDSRVLAEQAKCYIVGVQWVLSYYYHGVPSWSWFYPYNYAPFVSDVKGFGDLQIEFELCTPFLPFEQLLGVLPPASKSLLPKPFQALMVNDDSPIKDYYPVEFQTDLNGKEQEWEAVVLIPFINEERLLAAMREKNAYLTDEEVKRNVHGVCQVYCFDPELEGSTYPSPWPQVFPDITNCRVKCSELPAIPFPITCDELVPGLMPGVKLDIFFPGFPTLKHIPHTASLERKGVRVFQAASRDDNMCLTVQPRKIGDKKLYNLATELVGLQCYVGWPYLAEAKVHAVSDRTTKYYADPVSRSKVKIVMHVLKEKEMEQWSSDAKQVSRQYAEMRGIYIGPVEVLIYVNVLQGKRYIADKEARGSLILHKEWRTLAEPHPYDLSVVDIAAYAPEYKEKGIMLEELFKPKDQCFLLANPHYGFQAEVLSVDPQVRVHVRVKLLPEPDMTSVINNRHHLSVRYTPAYIVAQQLRLKSLVLSRISGNILVEKGTPDNTKERERLNIGLNLKFDRRKKEMPGYCRKTEDGWSYSPAAIELVKSFTARFPALFEYLQNKPKEDKYYESELFGGADSGTTLAEVRDWLRQLPVSNMETVDCGGQSLDEPQIAAVEKAVLDMKQKPKSSKTVKLRVKPAVLFVASVHQGAVVPDPKADYYLFDRVINVAANTAVPFGLKGTVIGIQGDGGEVGTHYEILFDDEFLGGLTLRCSSNRAYRLPPSCLVNLSFGARLKGKNTPKSQTPYRQQQSYSAGGQNLNPQGGSYSGAVMTGSGFSPLGHRGRGHTPHRQPPYPHHSHHYNQQHQQFNGPGYERYSPSYTYDEWDSPSGRGSGDYSRHRGVGGWRERDGESERRRGREGDGRGRGRARGRGISEREVTPRIITKSSSSPNKIAAQVSDRTTPQSTPSRSREQTSPTPSKQQQKECGRDREGGKDSFSAAITALEKLEISPAEKNRSPPGSARREKQPQPGRKTNRSNSNKELSPSVAAVFDTVNTSNQQSLSAKGLSSDGKDGPSLTLKAMLQMEEEGDLGKVESQEGEADMPEAIRKLMQPVNVPRGPLLPRPPYPLQSPLRHPPPPPPPHPQAQIFPAHRGVHPDYLSGPPPLMPFGPPPMDPLSTLHQTCQATGLPPPRVTTRQTREGRFIGVVVVDKNKYIGMPCATVEEAQQSAAAITNSNMLPAPMYYPMPYMVPPVPGPYSGPPILPPHVPLYPPPMPPYTYHPRGPQPIVHQSVLSSASPSFVPLQVQRRQTQRPQHSFPSQERPARYNSSLSSSRRPGSGKGKTGNPTKEEYAQVEGTTYTCITDDEKVQVERAKRCLQTPADTTAPGGAVPEVVDKPRESSEGLEGENEPSKVADVEESIMKRLEVAEKEKNKSLQMIANLTQTMSVIRDTSTQVESSNVIAPPSEVSKPTEERERDTVGDMVAQAAILSALEVDRKDSDDDYVEPIQSSDVVTSGAEVSAAEVHVVGEILGGECGELTNPSVPVEDSSSGCTATTDQQVPKPATVSQMALPIVSDQPTTTSDQQLPKTTTTTVTTGAESKASVCKQASVGIPSSAVKTSRPKRQLAASFPKAIPEHTP